VTSGWRRERGLGAGGDRIGVPSGFVATPQVYDGTSEVAYRLTVQAHRAMLGVR
jgi:hypothetical protein